MKKALSLLLSSALVLSLLTACGSPKDSDSGGSQQGSLPPIEITNVSYDPTRELYAAYNEIFEAHWKELTGQDVTVVQSHVGLQAVGDLQGLPAGAAAAGILRRTAGLQQGQRQSGCKQEGKYLFHKNKPSFKM